MRSTKIIKICSSSLCTCLHHMVILRTRNKISDFFMILAWTSHFKLQIKKIRVVFSHLKLWVKVVSRNSVCENLIYLIQRFKG